MNAQILGGPRDGEIVPYVGPYLRLPRPRPPRFVPASEMDRLPEASRYFMDEYELKRGFDGELFYVRLR